MWFLLDGRPINPKVVVEQPSAFHFMLHSHSHRIYSLGPFHSTVCYWVLSFYPGEFNSMWQSNRSMSAAEGVVWRWWLFAGKTNT